jgi:hypothetical protein
MSERTHHRGEVPGGSPLLLHDLQPGARLLELASGTVWVIERVARATPYATPWVHLASVAGDTENRRVIDAGALLSARDDGPVHWAYQPD